MPRLRRKNRFFSIVKVSTVFSHCAVSHHFYCWIGISVFGRIDRHRIHIYVCVYVYSYMNVYVLAASLSPH